GGYIGYSRGTVDSLRRIGLLVPAEDMEGDRPRQEAYRYHPADLDALKPALDNERALPSKGCIEPTKAPDDPAKKHLWVIEDTQGALRFLQRYQANRVKPKKRRHSDRNPKALTPRRCLICGGSRHSIAPCSCHQDVA